MFQLLLPLCAAIALRNHYYWKKVPKHYPEELASCLNILANWETSSENKKNKLRGDLAIRKANKYIKIQFIRSFEPNSFLYSTHPLKKKRENNRK